MSKLCAYIITGTPINQLQGYSESDLGINPAYQIIGNSDPIPTGYQDISSIENWWNLRAELGRDYKFIRNEIIILANVIIGWSSLSVEEKNISATIFAVDETKRDEIFTVEQQIINGWHHHKRSIASRRRRMTQVELELFNRVAKVDTAALFSELKENKLLDAYIDTGLEGTLEGDPEGIFDFIEGSLRTGTTWDGTGSEVGFYDKGYTVKGMTMSELTTHIMTILKTGNF